MSFLFLRGVLLQFTGTVGAGIFSLPYALYNSNFFLASLFLIFFGLLVTLINRFYLDVILATPGDHQLPGYCHIYLGRRFQRLAILNIFILATGALMAYLKLSSQFILSFFPQIPPFLASLCYFLVLVIFFILKTRSIRLIKHALPILIIFIPLLLLYISFQLHLSPIIRTPFSLSFLGPIFFAVSGFSIVPEVEEVLRPIHKPSWVRFASFFGTLLAVAVYLIFSFSIVRLSGGTLSPDTISGLQKVSLPLASILSILGLGSIFNASLNFLTVLKEIFFRDLKVAASTASLFALLVPFVCLFFTRISFLEIISLTGSITIFISVLLICLLRLRLPVSQHTKILLYGIVALFIVGLIAEFFL